MDYKYCCRCECGFRMEISLKRELDFDVLCVSKDCDLIMSATKFGE